MDLPPFFSPCVLPLFLFTLSHFSSLLLTCDGQEGYRKAQRSRDPRSYPKRALDLFRISRLSDEKGKAADPNAITATSPTSYPFAPGSIKHPRRCQPFRRRLIRRWRALHSWLHLERPAGRGLQKQGKTPGSCYHTAHHQQPRTRVERGEQTSTFRTRRKCSGRGWQRNPQRHRRSPERLRHPRSRDGWRGIQRREISPTRPSTPGRRKGFPAREPHCQAPQSSRRQPSDPREDGG